MIDLRCGDARAVLATLADASVDSVVTDPPYALTSGKNSTKGFMSARWDNGSVAHDPAFWAEVLRVAKPGAFLLAFGGTRTYHRLACAIEDAGWECRDMLNWLQGSGFPKSKSCLKPSHEPILLAKAPGPLQPLQIDACRVATGENLNGGAYTGSPRRREGYCATDILPGAAPLSRARNGIGEYEQPAGRWPPNTLFSHHPACQPAGERRVRGNGHHPATRGTGGLGTAGHSGQQGLTERHLTDEAMPAYVCVDGCAVKALDAQAGPSVSTRHQHGRMGRHDPASPQTKRLKMDSGGLRGHDDAGGPSRFFPTFGPDPEDAVPFRYVSKAPARERRLADGTPTGHPTQKPVALACWLASLVCRPGGTVLDPFAGVGSLGIGALQAGCHYLGIEQDAGYAAIAQRRLDEEQERRDGQLALPLDHACG